MPKFLSTPSVRRATIVMRDRVVWADISIHALREEGDRVQTGHAFLNTKFLSTPSVRRATGAKEIAVTDYEISIHALREEGDPESYHPDHQGDPNFYPRPP